MLNIDRKKILATFSIFPLTMHDVRLKGISICFDMLRAALSGGYVNFGVLRLYGDDAFDNALTTFVKTLENIEQRDIMVSDELLYELYHIYENFPCQNLFYILFLFFRTMS